MHHLAAAVPVPALQSPAVQSPAVLPWCASSSSGVCSPFVQPTSASSSRLPGQHWWCRWWCRVCSCPPSYFPGSSPTTCCGKQHPSPLICC